MSSCVPESAFNGLFGVTLCAITAVVLFSLYNTHVYNKIENGVATDETSRIAKNISQGVFIAFLVMLGLALFLYFGNTKRMIGVYANVPISAPRMVMH